MPGRTAFRKWLEPTCPGPEPSRAAVRPTSSWSHPWRPSRISLGAACCGVDSTPAAPMGGVRSGIDSPRTRDPSTELPRGQAVFRSRRKGAPTSSRGSDDRVEAPAVQNLAANVDTVTEPGWEPERLARKFIQSVWRERPASLSIRGRRGHARCRVVCATPTLKAESHPDTAPFWISRLLIHPRDRPSVHRLPRSDCVVEAVPPGALAACCSCVEIHSSVLALKRLRPRDLCLTAMHFHAAATGCSF